MIIKSARSFIVAIICLVLLFSFVNLQTAQAAPEPQTLQATVVPVTGNIISDTTWFAGNVYYLLTDVEVVTGVTLTIQGGAIVKFLVPFDPATMALTGLTVNGALAFTGISADSRVIFTSGRDDTNGGDSNADGAQTLPAAGDWDFVRLMKWADTDPAYEFLNIRYSKDGLNFHNTTNAVTPPDPEFRNNIFAENTCGLTLSLTANGSVNGNVHNNTFTQNKYGFCTKRTSGLGQILPTLNNNTFNNNTILPIYLFGTSYPIYGVDTNSNIFSGYIQAGDKLGIGLGGVFNGSGELTIVNGMPFVLVAPMEVSGAGVNLTVPAGAVFKGFTRAEIPKLTDPLAGLKVTAGITFNSSEAEPVIFTSYRDDDVGGDTNGDDLNSEPLAGDWAGVHFVDSRTPGDANYTFQYLSFRYAVNGLLYEATTTGGGARMPVIQNDTFIGNLNGLRFKAVSNNANSRIEPQINNNSFTNHGIIPANKDQREPGVPIMLENTVSPSYSNNTFSGNLHPAIGLTGRWRSSAVLSLVPGQGLPALPYLVHGEMWFGDANISGGVDNSAVLTIPQGTVIKFFVNNFDRNVRSRLVAAARLALASGVGTDPIVFTSYYDAAYGGNTDGDDGIGPALKDWGDVLIRHPQTDMINTVFRYGDKALHVENKSTTLDAFFDGVISNSLFDHNEYGLYLDIQATNDITSLISANQFQYNTFGLGTFAKDTLNVTTKATGVSRPTIIGNTFTGNTLFPIYLNGSATLEFFATSNVFTGNLHTAIALGGYFGAVSADPGFAIVLPKVMEGPVSPKSLVHVPYVVWERTNFDWYTPTELAGGVVVKFNTGKDINFYGKLTMLTTPLATNMFTSYRDDAPDANGDTNGTPAPNPAPAQGDWLGLYLYNRNTIDFSYSTIRYSDQGLVIYQKNTDPAPGTINFPISSNTFTLNKNGLTFYIGSNLDITSTVDSNIFVENNFGFHSFTNPATNIPHCGTANPNFTNNNFSLHSEFPIYLQGSANPNYNVDTPDSNNFWDNTHPAIAVGGVWCRDATWTKVYDTTFAQDMPYVVKETLTQEVGVYGTPTITLPASLIVKFMTNPYIYAYGYLELLSSPGNEIVFTAYSDDAYGGDIDNNGAPPAAISRSAWKTVWLFDVPGKFNDIHDLKVLYSTAGLGLYYDGPINTQTATIVRRSEFTDSHAGIALVIGWRQVGQVIYGGEGNVNASIQGNHFHDSNYGILTVVHDKATGIVNPVLENNTFTNIANYPIFLGGTSEFSFVGLNQIAAGTTLDAANSAPADSSGEELALGGFDLPGNQALLESIQPGTVGLDAVSSPQANLTAAPNLYPAIGMAGSWNNAVELVQIDGVPYAVTGNFPLTITANNINFKPADNVTIGFVNAAGAAVAVPAETIFKFSKDRIMTVKGTLNLLSTDSQPVIFTSIKDDAAAGDTNRDGTATRPAKADWGEVRLAASNNFHNAVVRYAVKGLHIYFDGAINLNNNSTVNHSTFMENTMGISFSALDNGDILATIQDSTFNLNTIHIQGNNSNVGKTGHLCVDAHNNDLFGSSTLQNGIENNNLNGVSPDLVDCPSPVAFDATLNYWGDASGPYHPTLNADGLGSRVSDRVLFDPWLASAVFPPATYSISGRITKDSAIGDGLPGVLVMLQGEVPDDTTAITDANGYYSFSGLLNGTYVVSPVLAGYLFSPPSLTVNLAGSDALDVKFIATISPAEVGFSVNSLDVLRPTTSVKKYCSFTVTMDKALGPGKSATVDFATVDGTALANVDYIARTGKLTFLSGQSLTQQVNVELKLSDLDDPTEFFSLTLKNPTNAYLLVSNGTCTLSTAKQVYLPMINK